MIKKNDHLSDNTIVQLDEADLDLVSGGVDLFGAACVAGFSGVGSSLGKAVTAETGGWGLVPGEMIGAMAGAEFCPVLETGFDNWLKRFPHMAHLVGRIFP